MAESVLRADSGADGFLRLRVEPKRARNDPYCVSGPNTCSSFCFERRHGKRFDQIIVGAELRRPLDEVRVGAAGKENEGGLLGCSSVLTARRNSQTVHSGHVEIG